MNQREEALSFAFDRERMNGVALARCDAYVAASPFPHAVIDGLFPDYILQLAIDEFSEASEERWQVFDRPNEIKFALSDYPSMGPVTRHVLSEMNGQVFMEFLETLTGIQGLVADHTFAGGGLHQIRPGGLLKIHADFNRHGSLQLDRRLNAILYLNSDWNDSYGGNLELWNADMTEAVVSVEPIFNRLVVFSTTDTSFHGHPTPLSCPADRFRRSLALYYYSNGRPQEETSSAHTTIFKRRPGERQRPRDALKQWVPPAALDLFHRLRS